MSATSWFVQRTRKTLLVVLLLTVAIVSGGASKDAIPVQDIEEPLETEAELLDSGGAAAGDGTAAYSSVNPWGCKAKSDRPHESTIDPGPGWIQAKSHTACLLDPPRGSVWTIWQRLYRSSWSGWKLVASKYSQCPVAAGAPTCTVTKMTAYVNWDCEAGTWYNYKVEGDHQLIAFGRTFSGISENLTGQFWQDGTVYCSQ